MTTDNIEKTIIKFTTRDALNILIKSERCVDEILNKNPDKIYLYATNIKKENDNYKVEIDSKKCIAILDTKILKSILDILFEHKIDANKVNNIKTIKNIRNGNNQGYLFSAGSIIRNTDGKVLMIERDLGAPSDRLHWQLPSGRCEEINSYNVAIAELDEEIFASKSDQRYFLSQNLIVNHKSYRQVSIYVDNTLEHINNSLVIMDKKNNTLEQLYIGVLKDYKGYILKDGEYDRKVEFISKGQTIDNSLKLVSLLKGQNEILFN
jgi:hypothetical protein